MFPLDSIIRFPSESSRYFPHRKAFASLKNLIGNTPMVEIVYTYKGIQRKIYAKCEYRNHTGSIKDRMALHILEQAYTNGAIKAGARIVEATSGNTGISFAAIGKLLGHQVTIILPDWLSRERKDLIRSFGAELIEVSREDGGFLKSILMSESMAQADPSVFLPQQFSNRYNTEVHARSTGPEIWEQLRKLKIRPDAFIAGIGTGGTLMGVGDFLKSKDSGIAIHPIEPAESPTLSTGYKDGNHRIQGISDDFIPALVNLSKLDKIVSVSDGDAIIMAQKISSEIGLGVGISSGANFIGAVELQNRLGDDMKVVTVFCDSNKKYLSTDLMKEEPVRASHLSRHIRLLHVNSIPALNTNIL